jgi:hypothetical protein
VCVVRAVSGTTYGMITIEEAKEKYSKTRLWFESYYKYLFEFNGRAADGSIIKVWYGGEPGEIYRFSISVDVSLWLGNIADWWKVEITKEGTVIFLYESWA